MSLVRKDKSWSIFCRDNGSMFIVVMVIMAVLTIFITGHLSSIAREHRMTKRYIRNLSALNLAEAGIEAAIWEMTYDNGDFTSSEGWTGPADLKTKTGSLLISTGDTQGEYSVSVGDPTGSAPVIVSTGYVPSATAADRKERTVRTEFLKVNGGIEYGIFGKDSITISGGSITDSYVSENGAYADQTSGDDGNVATNGDIIINGDTSYISGDATPGPGQTVSDPDQVSGDSTPNTDTVVLSPIPPAEIADAAIHNNNAIIPSEFWQGNPDDYRLKLTNGDSLILTEGTYYFTEFSMSGGTITTSGQVTIYLTGDCNMTGGSLINTSQIPANLIIKSSAAPNPDNMMLAGDSDIYAVVYAPSADIQIAGGGDFYGSAVSGGDLTISGGGSFHYDESLNSLNNGNASYNMVSWSESFL